MKVFLPLSIPQITHYLGNTTYLIDPYNKEKLEVEYIDYMPLIINKTVYLSVAETEQEVKFGNFRFYILDSDTMSGTLH